MIFSPLFQINVAYILMYLHLFDPKILNLDLLLYAYLKHWPKL